MSKLAKLYFRLATSLIVFSGASNLSNITHLEWVTLFYLTECAFGLYACLKPAKTGFLVVVVYSLYTVGAIHLFATGHVRCPCLGILSLGPRFMAILDISIAGILLLFLIPDNRSIDSQRLPFVLSTAVFSCCVTLAATMAFSATRNPPIGIATERRAGPIVQLVSGELIEGKTDNLVEISLDNKEMANETGFELLSSCNCSKIISHHLVPASPHEIRYRIRVDATKLAANGDVASLAFTLRDSRSGMSVPLKLGVPFHRILSRVDHSSTSVRSATRESSEWREVTASLTRPLRLVDLQHSSRIKVRSNQLGEANSKQHIRIEWRCNDSTDDSFVAFGSDEQVTLVLSPDDSDDSVHVSIQLDGRPQKVLGVRPASGFLGRRLQTPGKDNIVSIVLFLNPAISSNVISDLIFNGDTGRALGAIEQRSETEWEVFAVVPHDSSQLQEPRFVSFPIHVSYVLNGNKATETHVISYLLTP